MRIQHKRSKLRAQARFVPACPPRQLTAKSKLGCTAAPHPGTVPACGKLRAIELGITGLCGYRIGFHGT